MDKLRSIFDSKITWISIGSVVGSLWGDQAAAAINAVGLVVMQVL